MHDRIGWKYKEGSRAITEHQRLFRMQFPLVKFAMLLYASAVILSIWCHAQRT